MDCVRGQIMRSLKGHDKGDFQVVLKTDGAYAYMADGKRRRMEAPKKEKADAFSPDGDGAQRREPFDQSTNTHGAHCIQSAHNVTFKCKDW